MSDAPAIRHEAGAIALKSCANRTLTRVLRDVVARRAPYLGLCARA